MTEYSFEGVHLLPNNILPYRQQTYAAEGIELESWEQVYVCDICGNRLADISDFFTVLDNFQDTDTGKPQIIWSIYNCDMDAGYRLVYLEILSGENAPIYSSPFYLTQQNSQYTSYWNYKNDEDSEMLGIGFRAYYRNLKPTMEISSFTAVSTGNPMTAGVKKTRALRWFTDIVEENLLDIFTDIFLCRYVYSLPTIDDGLPQRTHLLEAIDTPDPEADENFVQTELKIFRNSRLTFDPNAIPIVPPPPPVDIPEITLTEVNSVGANTVQYEFTLDNFTVVPTEITLQYSSDEINWISYTTAPTSPANNPNATNNLNSGYYYRVYHYGTNTASNVLQLASPSLELVSTVTQATFNPAGNKYRMFYHYYNFIPTQQYIFESSIDEITWVPMLVGLLPAIDTGIQYATAQPSVDPFKFFRMRYSPLGLTSNTIIHEF